MRRGLRLAWKVFAVLLGLGCCIKSRVGAASASTTTRRCSASGATSAGPTSCRRTCARPSRRAWRTSTPSWAGRPSASSSAAGGRRTPRSQRGRAGDPDTQRKRSQHRLGVSFEFGILVHCFLCCIGCIGCFHFLHFDITSQLLEVGVPPTHPRRPPAGWLTTGPQS